MKKMFLVTVGLFLGLANLISARQWLEGYENDPLLWDVTSEQESVFRVKMLAEGQDLYYYHLTSQPGLEIHHRAPAKLWIAWLRLVKQQSWAQQVEIQKEIDTALKKIEIEYCDRLESDYAGTR